MANHLLQRTKNIVIVIIGNLMQANIITSVKHSWVLEQQNMTAKRSKLCSLLD